MKTLLILTFCMTLLFSAFSAGRKLLVIGEELPPMEFLDGGKVTGFDIDVITAVFKKMNIDFEVKLIPWERCWKMVENGEADAVLTTSRKKEREPFLFYPEEDLWKSEFVFFVEKSKKKTSFSGYKDAVGLNIGIVKGNSYNTEFWEYKFKTDEAYNLEMNLTKLANGRIDLVPADKIAGLYTAKKFKLLDRIDYYETVLFSKGYPMPFVKKSNYPDIENIAKEFEKQLIAFKKTGEYKNIQSVWIGK